MPSLPPPRCWPGPWHPRPWAARRRCEPRLPNARPANSADRFWQTVQHNAQPIAEPAGRDAGMSRWRSAINAVTGSSANRLPPSDLAHQVRRWNEVDQAERARQTRQGAAEQIILPADRPRLPENRVPPWQRPAPEERCLVDRGTPSTPFARPQLRGVPGRPGSDARSFPVRAPEKLGQSGTRPRRLQPISFCRPDS